MNQPPKRNRYHRQSANAPTLIGTLASVVTFFLQLLVLNSSSALRSEDAHPAVDKSEILFVRRIAPLFREKCVACHGGDPQEIVGSLDLRSLAGLLKGGDSEDPAATPAKSDESSLYLAARRDHDSWTITPPKDAEKLSEEQLTWLREWIETSARWPSKERHEAIQQLYAKRWSVEDRIPPNTTGGLSADWTHRTHDPAGLWAYQTVKGINVTEAENSGTNAIDFFIQRSQPEGLAAAPPATRRQLIRRAAFDLMALPPTPDEVEAFVADKRGDEKAFARRFPEFKVCLESDSHRHKWEPGGRCAERYEHPLWKQVRRALLGTITGKEFGPITKNAMWDYDPATELRNGDFLEDYRLIQALLTDVEPHFNVYDAAAWSAIAPLREKSVANRSTAVDFSDFTKGKWKTGLPLRVAGV